MRELTVNSRACIYNNKKYYYKMNVVEKAYILYTFRKNSSLASNNNAKLNGESIEAARYTIERCPRVIGHTHTHIYLYAYTQAEKDLFYSKTLTCFFPREKTAALKAARLACGPRVL